MKSFMAGWVFLSMAAACVASTVTMNELRRNPLWVPGETTVTRELAFTDGTKVRAGTVVKVDRLEGANVVIVLPGSGSTTALKPEGTSLLADAERLVAGLSPEQRKITPAALRSRTDLWPYHVRLRQEIEFSDGTRFAAGTPLALESFDGRNVRLIDTAKHVSYNFSPDMTDFYTSCLRAMVEPTTSRLYQELSAHVVDGRTRERVDFLAEGGPEYLAIYHAAAWCPYSAQTSPDVAAWFREQAASLGGRVRLLIVSNDKSAEEFAGHLAGLDTPSWAVPFDVAPRLFVLNGVSTLRALPNFYVVDRTGKVVVPATSGQPRDRVARVLAALPAL